MMKEPFSSLVIGRNQYTKHRRSNVFGTFNDGIGNNWNLDNSSINMSDYEKSSCIMAKKRAGNLPSASGFGHL